ncbi:MAG: hypothetical protein BGO13_08625 [Burkholderiales bacterium 66-5]|nr:MAG: hypothetical protein BGO13_08625 [Burkholderiales bacterium 66-5]
MSTPHINTLREHLLATLADLRNRENPMEPDRARAIAQVASVLVDTAKVEVDYVKATGQDRADFIEQPSALPAPSQGPTAHNPFPVSARHHLS